MTAALAILLAADAGAVPAPEQTDARGLRLIVVGAEHEAADVRARIDAGLPFAAAAERYSTDSTSAEGGFLGTFRPAELISELRAAAEGLAPGEVSAVTPFQGGFALVQWLSQDEGLWMADYRDGLLAFGSGDPAGALEGFSNAVRTAETLLSESYALSESLVWLADVHRAMGEDSRAVPFYERALAIREGIFLPPDPEILTGFRRLAAVYSALGDTAAAERLYEEAMTTRWVSASRNPEPGTLGQLMDGLAGVLSFARFRDAELESFLSRFTEVFSSVGFHEELYPILSDAFLAVNLSEEAEMVRLEAVRLYPGSRAGYMQLGEVYQQLDRGEEALAAYGAALEIPAPPGADPALQRRVRAGIYTTIGDIHSLLNNLDDAAESWRAALELDPEAAGPKLGLARIALVENRPEEGIATISSLARMESAEVQHTLAQLRLSLGQLPEAVDLETRALEIDPEHLASRYTRGRALIRMGRTEEGQAELAAYQALERMAAEEITANRRRQTLMMGAIEAAGEGDAGAALEAMAEGLAYDPDNLVLNLNLGVLQSRLGFHENAIATFESILERDLGMRFLIHWNLAREFARVGNQDASRMHHMLYLQGCVDLLS